MRPARTLPSDEGGFAMIMTIVVTLVVVTLLSVIFMSGLASAPLSRHDQDYQAALQAAEAGIQDYINRLDANTAYYLQTTDATNPAMGGSWAQVCPSSSNCSGTAENEYYSYAVNSTSTESTGTLQLTVSGAAGANPNVGGTHPVIRTIKVQLSLSSNDSSLYYTKYEIEDPNFVSSFPLGPSSAGAETNYQNYCVYQAWAENTQISSGGTYYYGPDEHDQSNGAGVCSPYLIYFAAADTLNGQIKSDDEFNICGAAQFPDGAISGYDQGTGANVTPGSGVLGQKYAAAGTYNNGGCSGAPSFCSGNTATYCQGSQPSGQNEDSFPTTNTNLKQDLATTQDGGGCYYEGPITVTLNPAASGHTTGTMSVVLDGTSKALSTTPGGLTVENAANCVGTNISYPNNGLLYDDTGTDGTADVYIQGENAVGPITIGSAANITITNNIQDTNTSTSSGEIVGLWAQKDIYLPDSFNQVPGQTYVMPQVSSLIVDAAMVADSDSIYLPCWTNDNGQSSTGHTTSQPTTSAVGCPTSPNNPTTVSTTVNGHTTSTTYYFNTVTGSITGDSSISDTCDGSNVPTPTRETTANLGFLTICGSLAQTFRGPVGTESNGTVVTGYGKNYTFDNRLQYLQPPYFNAITTPNWTPTDFEECNATAGPTSSTAAPGPTTTTCSGY